MADCVPSAVTLLHSLVERERQNGLPKLQKGPGLATQSERDVQVRWIVCLVQSEQMGIDTCCMAVANLDRLLFLSRVQSKYANCLALSILYAAMKVCLELDAVPSTADLLRRLGTPYSRTELHRMELAALSKLRFDLYHAPSLQCFVQALLSVCAASIGGGRPSAVALYGVVEEQLNWMIPLLLIGGVRKSLTSHLAFGLLSITLQQAHHHSWTSLTAAMQHALNLSDAEVLSCRQRVANLCGLLPSQLALDGDVDKENATGGGGRQRKGGVGETRKRARIYSKGTEPKLKLQQQSMCDDDLELDQAFLLLYG